jgi:hypothetical protein
MEAVLASETLTTECTVSRDGMEAACWEGILPDLTAGDQPVLAERMIRLAVCLLLAASGS